MRYRQLKEVVFVNSNGEKKALHGCRPAEVYTSTVNQAKEKERELDDFAVSIWGPRSEIMSYRLREQNIERMLVEDFNERAFTNVSIPPRL